ncbi:MAG TPA: hypothetical protein VEX39_16375 [Thermoleophilaceae bacterium]|nr:hypothetical protein [Thermoleophilaceae bacterium]
MIISVFAAGPAAASPASAPVGSVKDAKETLQLTVQAKTDTHENGLDVFRARCKRLGSRTVSCRFRAVSFDRRWVGSAKLRYLGKHWWRYRLTGRVEDCGPSGCSRTGRFRWRGRIGSAQLL